jgi:membrane-associated HD superfamily phosphohydrolase
VDKTQFQYPGPLPQSKEAALVMLADIVESTTKAKQLNNEQDIVRIIDTTIQRMIGEGQLREAPITFKELELAKEAMIPVLESIYRKRLDYPEIKSQ